jgi:hypothetical protein
MPRREFQFGGGTIGVEAAEEPLAWLHEFVTPHFAAHDGRAADRVVTLTIDPREHGRLASHGPHPQRITRPCFTLDSGIVSGHVWDVPGAGEVVLDEERDAFYRRRPEDPGRIEVVVARDGTDARVAIMRAVREYAMAYARRAGWMLLHAAAVSIESETFVIAGPKRTGKTTLLLHALRNERGTYLANDRVALAVEPSGLTVHGIPTIVVVRRDSASRFDGLTAQLTDARYHYRDRVATRHAEHRAATSTPAATWGLSPPQLCHLLDVESRASARVTAVLFPYVGTLQGGTTFAKLSVPQALNAWFGSLFRPCPPGGLFEIGESGVTSPEVSVDLLASRFAAQVPSVSCHLGTDAYRDGVLRLSAAIRAAVADSTA